MKDKLYISARNRNVIVASLVGLYLIFIAFSIKVTLPLVNKPFPGFFVLKNNLVNMVTLPGWEGVASGIKPRDIILEVNGRPVANSSELRRIVENTEPGTILDYTVLRGNDRLIRSVMVKTFTRRDYAVSFLLWTSIGLSVFIAGLVVFFLAPNSPAGRSFLLVGFLVGFVTATTFEFCTVGYSNLYFYFFPLIGPAVLMIGMYFPEPIKKRKRFYIFIAANAIPLVILYRVSIDMSARFYKVVDTIFLIQMITNTMIGVILMVYSFITSKDPLTKQRGKLVVYGFFVGASGAVLVFIGVFVLKKINFYWIGVPTAAIPVTLAYAIVKRNLFDVDIFIRRTASYFLVAGLSLILFFVIVGATSVLFQNIAGQTSQAITVFATLLIVVLFRPIQTRVDKYISRRFFREKYEYRETIKKAFNVLAGIIELDKLIDRILDTVLTAIHIDNGTIILKDKEKDRFRIAEAKEFSEDMEQTERLDCAQEEAKLEAGDYNPVLEYLDDVQKPVTIYDVKELDKLRERKTEFLQFMEDLGIILAIPILYDNRLMGVLGLGMKKSEPGYSSEDIDLIQTLMMQTAISIENARKVEEMKKLVELESSYRELQHVNEMKDNFISMVSHDLRTPMTNIIGYASFLHEGIDEFDHDFARKYLEVIVDEGQRLTKLVTDILDIQKYEAGRMVMEPQELDVLELVDQSCEVFMPTAGKKNIAVEKRFPGESIYVSADPDRLKQVMANLLSNAIKFTPEGGKVTASIEKISDNGKGAVKVSVSDTGCGISEENQARLFRKFMQIDNLIRKKEEGSGLGLALVREIIEHHGGRVGVESRENSGSVFFFILETSK